MLATEQDKREWEVNRLTELLLTGYKSRKVRDFMRLSKGEFDVLLDHAVAKAQRERERIEIESPEMR